MSENPAAFPCQFSDQTSTNQEGAPFQAGMTLRDYFAGQMAAGATAQARFPTIWDQDADWLKKQKLTEIQDMSDKIALVAYSLADAMLKAREA